MRLAGPAMDTEDGPTSPNYTCAGRYEFTARRTAEGAVRR